MRRILVQTFVSLDGVMQAPGGPDEDRDGGFALGGWTVNYWDEKMGATMGAAMAEETDLLLGRRTYDIFHAHWPKAGDAFMTPRFNRVTKHVLTHHPETATWENTEPLGPDPVARLRELKEGEGRDLSVSGSSQLIQLLLAHDLVDRLSLWVFPLTLGSGKRLFGEGTGLAGFDLVGHDASTTGVMVLDYARAEARPAGSFALEDARGDPST